MSEPDGELYLILHKVRGEPAFDVAIKSETNGEVLWITASYGHRAYPFNQWRLEDLHGEDNRRPIEFADDMPSDWEEHFKVEPSKAKTGGRAAELIKKLGLSTAPFPMETERRA